MRIRRIEAEWPKGKVSIDLRGESGNPLSIIGIVGGNGSGKSLLKKMVIRLFRNAMYPNTCFLDWDEISGYAEFEYGGAIATGVVKRGKIVQSLVFPDTVLKDRQILGGLLSYEISLNNFTNAGFEALSRNVLSDLYTGDIKNSVIWVDSFDIGLDSDNRKEFLRLLIRKSLEKNNQLIVSTAHKEALSEIDEQGIRNIGSGENIIHNILNDFKKK